MGCGAFVCRNDGERRPAGAAWPLDDLGVLDLHRSRVDIGGKGLREFVLRDLSHEVA